MSGDANIPEWLDGDRGIWLFIGIALTAVIFKVALNIIRSRRGEKVDWRQVAVESYDGIGLTIVFCIFLASIFLIVLNLV